jgi:hypothetical protein
VFGPEEERVFAMQNGLFQDLFAEVIIQGSPWTRRKGQGPSA